MGAMGRPVESAKDFRAGTSEQACSREFCAKRGFQRRNGSGLARLHRADEAFGCPLGRMCEVVSLPVHPADLLHSMEAILGSPVGAGRMIPGLLG